MSIDKLTSEMRYMLTHSPVPIAVYQFIDGKIVTIVISKGFIEEFGYENEEDALNVMNHDMYRDAHPDDVARVADLALKFATEGGTYSAVYRNKTKFQSDYHIIHATGNYYYTANGDRYAIVWYLDETKDLNEEFSLAEKLLSENLKSNVEFESKLRKIKYDDLTGVPGNVYFMQKAKEFYDKLDESGQKKVSLYIDMSNLKLFNHKYGFYEGNKLIQALAKLIRKYFGYDNCGRFGADHFGVATTYTGLDTKLKSFLDEASHMNDGKTLPVRIGIYVFDDNKDELEIAFDKAKIAADSIKGTFYSSYKYFDKNMNTENEMKEYVLSSFSEALEKKWINIYVQPIVSASSGMTCDEEALARWIDPNLGMIGPDVFIPVLEDAGLLFKLDLYIVDRIIYYLKLKMEAGLELVPISVNLSEKDFINCDMLCEIKKRMDENGLDLSLLTLEITERSIGKNPELLKGIVSKSHELGFKVWLDDFGSEYSSLNVLNDFDFDLIKLDMKFLRKMVLSKKSKVIIANILELALKLGVDTVAEGVEAKEQAEFLRDNACVKFQGYLYSKPQDIKKLIDWYKNGELNGN